MILIKFRWILFEIFICILIDDLDDIENKSMELGLRDSDQDVGQADENVMFMI